MQVKHKRTGAIGYSNQFNIHGLGEIIVGFQDGDMDSDYIKNYDVFLEKRGIWYDLAGAFLTHDIIIDNYNTIFFEPKTEEDKIRGYTL